MVVFGVTTRGVMCACSGIAAAALGLAAQAQAQSAPRALIGAPYQAAGLWWVPAAQPNYEAVGAARVSPALRTHETGDLTAAHATLPLPSTVDVTNLDSGQTARLRLTERGSAVPGRLLELSPASARALGVQGEARVRVKLVSSASAAKTYAAAPPLRTEERRSPAGSAFAVQAGAFGDRDRADRAALRLASAGHAEVGALDRGGQRLWRVLVPAADAAAAETSRLRIAALGFADARIVRGF